MTQIIPNTKAVPQIIGSSPVVINGSDHSWIPSQIMYGVKVIHVGDYSFSAEETGGGAAELKITLQRDIGSGWENQAGEVSSLTFTAGQDRRFRVLCKVPYYEGIEAGILPKYRLLAECPTGEVTLHSAEGSDGIPSGQWKAEYEFKGEKPVSGLTLSVSTPELLTNFILESHNFASGRFLAKYADDKFGIFFRKNSGYDISASSFSVAGGTLTGESYAELNPAIKGLVDVSFSPTGVLHEGFVSINLTPFYIVGLDDTPSIQAEQDLGSEYFFGGQDCQIYIPESNKIIVLLENTDYLRADPALYSISSGTFNAGDRSVTPITESYCYDQDSENLVGCAVGNNLVVYCLRTDTPGMEFCLVNTIGGVVSVIGQYTSDDIDGIPRSIAGDGNGNFALVYSVPNSGQPKLVCGSATGDGITFTPSQVYLAMGIAYFRPNVTWVNGTEYFILSLADETDTHVVKCQFNGASLIISNDLQTLSSGFGGISGAYNKGNSIVLALEGGVGVDTPTQNAVYIFTVTLT